MDDYFAQVDAFFDQESNPVALPPPAGSPQEAAMLAAQPVLPEKQRDPYYQMVDQFVAQDKPQQAPQGGAPAPPAGPEVPEYIAPGMGRTLHNMKGAARALPGAIAGTAMDVIKGTPGFLKDLMSRGPGADQAAAAGYSPLIAGGLGDPEKLNPGPTRAVIDRIEGDMAVVEFEGPDGEPVLRDMPLLVLPDDVGEGDVMVDPGDGTGWQVTEPFRKEPGVRAVVDRIEGDVAVVEMPTADPEKYDFVDMPLLVLPEGLEEGDVITDAGDGQGWRIGDFPVSGPYRGMTGDQAAQARADRIRSERLTTMRDNVINEMIEAELIDEDMRESMKIAYARGMEGSGVPTGLRHIVTGVKGGDPEVFEQATKVVEGMVRAGYVKPREGIAALGAITGTMMDILVTRAVAGAVLPTGARAAAQRQLGTRLAGAAEGVAEGLGADVIRAGLREDEGAGTVGLGAGLGAVMGAIFPGGQALSPQIESIVKEALEEAGGRGQKEAVKAAYRRLAGKPVEAVYIMPDGTVVGRGQGFKSHTEARMSDDSDKFTVAAQNGGKEGFVLRDGTTMYGGGTVDEIVAPGQFVPDDQKMLPRPQRTETGEVERVFTPEPPRTPEQNARFARDRAEELRRARVAERQRLIDEGRTLPEPRGEEPRALPPGDQINPKVVERHRAVGGSTIDPVTGDDVTEGISVAVRPGDDMVTSGDLTPEDVARFREKFADELSEPGMKIGTWKREDGMNVLDVVRVFPENKMDDALALGRANKQDALFNLRTLEEIDLRGAPRRMPAQTPAAPARQIPSRTEGGFARGREAEAFTPGASVETGARMARESAEELRAARSGGRRAPQGPQGRRTGVDRRVAQPEEGQRIRRGNRFARDTRVEGQDRRVATRRQPGRQPFEEPEAPPARVETPEPEVPRVEEPAPRVEAPEPEAPRLEEPEIPRVEEPDIPRQYPVIEDGGTRMAPKGNRVAGKTAATVKKHADFEYTGEWDVIDHVNPKRHATIFFDKQSNMWHEVLPDVKGPEKFVPMPTAKNKAEAVSIIQARFDDARHEVLRKRAATTARNRAARSKPPAKPKKASEMTADELREAARKGDDAVRATQAKFGIKPEPPIKPKPKPEAPKADEEQASFFDKLFDVKAPKGMDPRRGGYLHPIVQREASRAGVGAAAGAGFNYFFGDETPGTNGVDRIVAGALLGATAIMGAKMVSHLGKTSNTWNRWMTGGGKLVGESKRFGDEAYRGVQRAVTSLGGRAAQGERKITQAAGDLFVAVRKTYGEGARTRWGGITSRQNPFETVRKASPEDYAAVKAYMSGDGPIDDVPELLRDPLMRMRLGIDDMSDHMVKEGLVEGPLAQKFKDGLGSYLTRSYRMFDDKGWVTAIRDDGTWVPPKGVSQKDWDGIVNRFKTWYHETAASMDIDLTADELDDAVRKFMAKGKHDNPLQFIVNEKLGRINLNHLAARNEKLAPELRALWGEHKDPWVNFVRTLTKQHTYVANAEWLGNLRQVGVKGRFMAEGDVALPGGRTGVFIPKNDFRYGSLRGHTVEKGFYDAMEEQLMGTPMRDGIARVYLGLMSLSKVAKTVGSPVTHVRNVVGNTSFAWINGYTPAAIAREGYHSVGDVLVAAGWKEGTQSRRSFVNKLVKLGVIDDNANAVELEAAIREVLHQRPEDLWDNGTKVHRATMRKLYAGADKLKHAGRMAYNTAQTAYRAEDDLWKIISFQIERSRAAKAGIPKDQLDEYAAEITRSVFPTFSLTPEIVNKTRRWGGFISFPAEVYRTTKNTIRQIEKELGSDNAAIRRIGWSRVAGVASYGTMLGGVTAATKFMFGISDAEEDAVRSTTMWWNENSNYAFMGPVEDGKYKYFDTSYLFPHSYMVDPLNAMLRGENWQKSVGETVKQLVDPFIGGAPLGSEFLKAAETAHLAADFEHPYWNAMARGLTPGGWDQFWRIVTGESQSGRKVDRGTEAFAVATGLRGTKNDSRETVRYVLQSLSLRTGRQERPMKRAAERGGAGGRIGRWAGRNIHPAIVQYFNRNMIEDTERAIVDHLLEAAEVVRATLVLGTPPEEVDAMMQEYRVPLKYRPLIIQAAAEGLRR